MKTILIIDDDISIGNLIEEVLKRKSYAVLRAYSGSEALLVLKEVNPDLILLDLMLPGVSGEEVLTKIKGIPVIVLSAKTAVEDKVNVLLGGATDYLTKPFDIEELLARIEVRLREASFSSKALVYKYDDIILDTDSHIVTIAEKPLVLTRTEYAILKLLIQNPDKVITKSSMLDRISVDTLDCTDSSLKTHISHLRSKMREISDKDYIEAIWGIGFKLKK